MFAEFTEKYYTVVLFTVVLFTVVLFSTSLQINTGEKWKQILKTSLIPKYNQMETFWIEPDFDDNWKVKNIVCKNLAIYL